jgi:biotin transport system substrate-specific component
MKIESLTRAYSLTNSSVLVVVFALLMIMSAYLRIPLFFTPVPITLQTLVVYLSIVFLKKKAFFAQLLYLTLGLSGFSIFANGGAGLLYLFGPTGGYILGFLAAAFIFAFLLPHGSSFLKNFIFFTSAAAVIYGFGLVWLILFHHFSAFKALMLGLYPFILGEIFKITIAAFTALKINKKFVG